MPDKRCNLCGAPLRNPGQTNFCSPRCVSWDFFGVPALKEGAFVREVRANQSRDELPGDWERPRAYPALGERFEQEIVEAIVLLNQTNTDR